MRTPPTIDVVIIGLNSGRTLAACLESVRDCHFPSEQISIIYADGGSSDDSLSIAESFDCDIVMVEAASPTPGRQRNAGWRHGSAGYVQFLDSDTILDPEWLAKAVHAIATEGVGAVIGDRRESHPEKSIFNWIGDLEWNTKPGEVVAFGGDVLIGRPVLELTGGYDPDLIAGEDPELSYRIRSMGYRIIKLAESMTKHDLSMNSLRQYFKRSFRSGHAFAEIHALHKDMWGEERRRIVVRASSFFAGVAALPFAVLTPWILLLSLAGYMILIRPRLLLVRQFQKALSLDRRGARLYAWHASLVVLPQFLGILRFHLGRLVSRPLSNRSILRKGRAAA